MRLSRRKFVGLLGSAPAIVAGRSLTEDQPVLLKPGDDIQNAVDSHPENTIFSLQSGIYRDASFAPKHGQRFVGQPGAILNGSALLHAWRFDGRYWIHENLPKPLKSPHSRRCVGERPLCNKREQLFLNNGHLRRVAGPEDLEPGTWFFDEDSQTALMLENPRGQNIEITRLERAVKGGEDRSQTISDVSLENLVFEKYAGIPNQGVVGNKFTYGWRFVDIVCSNNQGTGCIVGTGARVSGGRFVHNGQAGMGGGGDGIVIDGAEFSHNNQWSGFNPAWAAGGAKYWNVTNFTMRNCISYNNIGPGLWWDHRCDGVLIENNLVFDNSRQGIHYEISKNATIRYNRCIRNAWKWWKWVFGSQILLQNSESCILYRNFCEISSCYGHGITIPHQTRGYPTRNNVVEYNYIVHLGEQGVSGIAADSPAATTELSRWLESMRFDHNTYVIPKSGNHAYWGWLKPYKDFADFRQHSGQEMNGKLIKEKRAATRLKEYNSNANYHNDSCNLQ